MKLDGPALYAMMLSAANALDNNKVAINNMNVFPVPDGDTGINMSLTLNAVKSIDEGSANTKVSELSKKIASLIKEEIKNKIENEYKTANISVPTLACIIVGDNPASKVYVANKEKACASVGFNSIIERLDEDSTEQEVIALIEKLNNDASVSGILLQLPLPKHLDESKIIEHINCNKDVDGLTESNLGRLFSGNALVAPCTAKGIIDILDAYNIEIEGKHAVVIGRSLLVGKSVSILLQERNATVTMCHSRTRNLSEITKQADILVVAIGKPKFVTADMVKDDAVVIDVGINRLETGLVGDVDYDNVKGKVSYITPVPGGVGPMTIAELLKNTLLLHELNK